MIEQCLELFVFLAGFLRVMSAVFSLSLRARTSATITLRDRQLSSTFFLRKAIIFYSCFLSNFLTIIDFSNIIITYFYNFCKHCRSILILYRQYNIYISYIIYYDYILYCLYYNIIFINYLKQEYIIIIVSRI